jgi:TatD DNase family protein
VNAGGAAGAGGASPGWFDSHCHVQPPYGPDGVDAVDELLARARAAGVDRFVCVGTDLASSRLAVELAGAHPDVWATVGLHPHDAARLPAEQDELHALAASAPRVVGVGEAGFDLYYRHAEPPEQEAAFRRQIRWAGELGRTLVIHTRDAWDDTFRVLVEEGVPDRTVFHCFTGGPAEAARALSSARG